MLALIGGELAADHGQRVVDLVAGVRSVKDRKIENGLAGARRRNHPHHVLGREYHRGVDIEHLVLRLRQIDRGRGGAVLGMAVDGIDEVLVKKVFRREFEALGVAAFPGRRAQIAGGYLAFAGIKFGDLAEFQRIAIAGIAVEVVENAPAHADDLRVAASLTEREVVDGAMRHQHDRARLAP